MEISNIFVAERRQVEDRPFLNEHFRLVYPRARNTKI